VVTLCRLLEVPRSSYHEYRIRLRDEQRHRERQKPGPKAKVDDGELLGWVRRVLEKSVFATEGTKKVHRRLRHWFGVVASRKRVCAVMRDAGLLSPQRIESDRKERTHEGTLIPETIDRLWGTDGTHFGLPDGTSLWLFATIDHFSAEILGWHVIEVGKGTAYAALEPVRQAVRKRRGAVSQGAGAGVKIRHDWGPQYAAKAFGQELDFLGLENSPAFVHEPETNGVIERFFRTIKEECLWLHDFRDADQAREVIGEWMERYNEEWILERHGYRSPREVRRNIEAAIVAA
jgi:transposase InsO family protein